MRVDYLYQHYLQTTRTTNRAFAPKITLNDGLETNILRFFVVKEILFNYEQTPFVQV